MIRNITAKKAMAVTQADFFSKLCCAMPKEFFKASPGDGVYGKKFTARGFSNKTTVNGLVFVTGHVMPVVNGTVSNFNGHGDKPITVIAVY